MHCFAVPHFLSYSTSGRGHNCPLPLPLSPSLALSPFPPLPGVLVQGVARLHYGALTPLYESKVGEESREMAVHRHYVVDSLSLFLLYFLQLAVMATYISQDLLKMVPLLTIVFAFGRCVKCMFTTLPQW